jgi:hypothetical protein
MKKFYFTYILLLISVICLSSCSTNGFFVKKNHQPRVRIETQAIPDEISPVHTTSISSVQVKEEIKIKEPKRSVKKTNTPFFHKLLVTFYPKQKKILDKVYHHPKHDLGVSRLDEGDGDGGDRTTGLIINLLALAFGIAAILMVIGVAHGSLWVYFVVGLVLSAAAIIMGMIGKGMPWKGFGWLAGVLGIIAVVLLIIFMVLVAVVHTTF